VAHSAAGATSWFGRGLFRGPPLRHARTDFSCSNLNLQRWLAKGKLSTRTRRMASGQLLRDLVSRRPLATARVLKGSTATSKRMQAGHETAIPRARTEQVMNEVADERLMTIADLSAMLGVPIDTLYGWRHRGEGPRGYRVGRHVRYRRSSVEAWLEEQADRRQSARE
jgi:excisionase family DNA binding protein